MSMISILQEKIKQPFSYIRRRRENFVVGVTDITLVGWCTLHEYNRARSNIDESTATGDQRRNHIVCSFKIVLTNSTAVSTTSDSVLHRKLKASRHLKRLASRCDCHILKAHRSRMTLSMYSPLAAQPPVSLEIDLSIDSDATTTTLSPEKEQSLKQMLEIINAEVLRQRVFVLHKPLGVVSSTVDDAEAEGIREGRPTVYDLASEAGFPSSFAMVGRLDADTSGLVMFTDDTQLARAIRDPDPTDPEDNNLNRKHQYPSAADRKTLKTKEYVLTLLTGGSVLRQRKARLALCSDMEAVHEAEETELLRTLTEPFVFHKAHTAVHVSRSEAHIIRRFQDPAYTMGRPDLGLGWCLEVRVLLREGKHHQIRRAVKRTGFILLHLLREKMAGVSLQVKVPLPGQCSWLSHEEVRILREGLGLDSFS